MYKKIILAVTLIGLQSPVFAIGNIQENEILSSDDGWEKKGVVCGKDIEDAEVSKGIVFQQTENCIVYQEKPTDYGVEKRTFYKKTKLKSIGTH